MMLKNVYAIKVNDLLPSLSQLRDPILPEMLRPGADPLLVMAVETQGVVVFAWRDVRRIRWVMHVNVAQLGKLIRGHFRLMGCGVVEEEDLLEALRPEKFESPVHLYYFVHHGLGVHRRAFGKQLPVYRSMGADPKALKVLLAVNIPPNEAKEADEKINAAFGQGCSTIRTAYRWYQKFRNGDESLEEHERRVRHSDVDEDKLRDVVEEDPHKGTREIAKVLGVSHNTAARHLKEIGKTKKLERWVPHELYEEQRNR
ncbi:unnamed protein product [Heligmosomoides polygyrus]|uniref:HTH_48 domain-containing protein n=1 Tax=Heligmosomoides polygyrus TaxID=6339 RepID=A0A3P7YYR5_HELPZ|nr:unnamed protein product [Heligmosomoides polygyrus]